MNDYIFELFFFGVLILVFFVIYYLFKFIIKKELLKKKTKRISNSKTVKIITRRGEDFEYEFPLNPNIDEFWIRLFAKVLDYGFYLGIFYPIDRILIEKILYPYLLAFLALFIINPIFESFTGRTFGKYVLGMRVIDDFGGNPSLLISFIKNSFQCFVIVGIFMGSNITDLEGTIFLHNKTTFTYTIWNKDKEKILTQLNNQTN